MRKPQPCKTVILNTIKSAYNFMESIYELLHMMTYALIYVITTIKYVITTIIKTITMKYISLIKYVCDIKVLGMMILTFVISYTSYLYCSTYSVGGILTIVFTSLLMKLSCVICVHCILDIYLTIIEEVYNTDRACSVFVVYTLYSGTVLYIYPGLTAIAIAHVVVIALMLGHLMYKYITEEYRKACKS